MLAELSDEMGTWGSTSPGGVLSTKEARAVALEAIGVEEGRKGEGGGERRVVVCGGFDLRRC